MFLLSLNRTYIYSDGDLLHLDACSLLCNQPAAREQLQISLPCRGRETKDLIKLSFSQFPS